MLFITILVYLSPSNSAHFSKQDSKTPGAYSDQTIVFSGDFYSCKISVQKHVSKLNRD